MSAPWFLEIERLRELYTDAWNRAKAAEDRAVAAGWVLGCVTQLRRDSEDSEVVGLREHRVARLEEALRQIILRHPRGCGVIHSGRENGWTCLDEQQLAIDQPAQYSREFGEDVAAGKRRCDVCVARAALLVSPHTEEGPE